MVIRYTGVKKVTTHNDGSKSEYANVFKVSSAVEALLTKKEQETESVVKVTDGRNEQGHGTILVDVVGKDGVGVNIYEGRSSTEAKNAIAMWAGSQHTVKKAGGASKTTTGKAEKATTDVQKLESEIATIEKRIRDDTAKLEEKKKALEAAKAKAEQAKEAVKTEAVDSLKNQIAKLKAMGLDKDAIMAMLG